MRKLFISILSVLSALSFPTKIIAAEYYPSCLWDTFTLRASPQNNTVICQSNFDENDWELYDFASNYDNTYDLTLSIGIDRGDTEYDKSNIVSVHLLNSGEPATIFYIEEDGTITPTKNANMALAALYEDKIKELFQVRRQMIGY